MCLQNWLRLSATSASNSSLSWETALSLLAALDKGGNLKSYVIFLPRKCEPFRAWKKLAAERQGQRELL
jgi:hypothetical protein